MPRDVSPERYLKTSPEETERKLWSKTKKEGGFISGYYEGEKIIKGNSKMILFGVSPYIEAVFESFPCEIVTTEHSYGQEGSAFGFNNKSAYVELFNYHILMALSSKWKSPFDIKKGIDCTTDEEEIFRPMSYSEIFSAFVMIGIGILISIICCLFELIFHTKKVEIIGEDLET